MTSNIRIMGRCYNGKVAHQSQWLNPSTQTIFHGVSYDTCENCGGGGCNPDASAVLADATRALSDAQKLELAEAVERIVGAA